MTLNKTRDSQTGQKIRCVDSGMKLRGGCCSPCEYCSATPSIITLEFSGITILPDCDLTFSGITYSLYFSDIGYMNATIEVEQDSQNPCFFKKLIEIPRTEYLHTHVSGPYGEDDFYKYVDQILYAIQKTPTDIIAKIEFYDDFIGSGYGDFPGPVAIPFISSGNTATDGCFETTAENNRTSASCDGNYVYYDGQCVSFENNKCQVAQPWENLTVYDSGRVVIESSYCYNCIQPHTSDIVINKPGSGSNWQDYWERTQ